MPPTIKEFSVGRDQGISGIDWLRKELHFVYIPYVSMESVENGFCWEASQTLYENGKEVSTIP